MLQLAVTAPPGHTFAAINVGHYAISPDGSKLAFVAISAEGKRSLWVRPPSTSRCRQDRPIESAHRLAGPCRSFLRHRLTAHDLSRPGERRRSVQLHDRQASSNWLRNGNMRSETNPQLNQDSG